MVYVLSVRKLLYLSKGPQEIQLGKAGSSLVKKEPKQQVNHAVVRACLGQPGLPVYPGSPGRLPRLPRLSQATQAVQANALATVPGYAGSAQVKLRI